MGLFAYTRILSSAMFKQAILRPYPVISVMPPILFSTPQRLITLVVLSTLDPLSLIENQLKELMANLLSNPQRKITS